MISRSTSAAVSFNTGSTPALRIVLPSGRAMPGHAPPPVEMPAPIQAATSGNRASRASGCRRVTRIRTSPAAPAA
ncbi:MAG: hypothetical protein LC704_07925 [Actinobacteria bacterium]|nr:hypothetical protein [Actinomycetota bacterium]